MASESHVNGAARVEFDEASWNAQYADGYEPAKPSLRILYGSDLDAELPDLDYLVEDLAMVSGGGAPHLIAGYGFSGKTVAVQSMCLSLAAGKGVWGVHRVKQRRVLHVDFEQGERLTQRRYQRLSRAMGLNLPALGDALAVVSMPRLTLSPDHRDTWKELMTGRDLIIVDSLRAAAPGIDENSSQMREPLDLLGSISNETHCRPTVLHHASKPKEGGGNDAKFSIRGSGAIFDACDCVYVFAATKGDPVSVRQEKARSHGEPIEDFALKIEDVAGANDDFKWGLSVNLHGVELLAKVREERAAAAEKRRGESDMRTVERALTKHPGALSSDLRAVTGLGGARLTAAMLALGNRIDKRPEQDGRVRRVRHFLIPGRPS